MKPNLFFPALLALAWSPAAAAAPAPLVRAQDDAAYEQRLAAAGADPARLFELATWCKEQDKEEQAVALFRRIIEIDANHEGAHRGLRHHFYDGKWFETYSALSKYRREEADRMLKEEGKVRYKDEWVPQEDVVYLRMSWVKDESGAWRHPGELEQEQREAELREQGWQQQDLVWISPDEFDKWHQKLYKCGEEWKTPEEADAYHAELLTPWAIRSQEGRFEVYGTLDRVGMDWAAWWADRTYPDLVRATGQQPKKPPAFVVLRSIEQYNQFAAGDQNLGLPPTEGTGASSLHYAYFTDAWLNPNPPGVFRGLGVCYWNRTDEALAPYGRHAVQHAAALSFIDAIDPSWNAISVAIGNAGQLDVASFYAEKKMPIWFRYGLASYCERFFRDSTVGEDGNPFWAREWAMANLRSGGPIDTVETIVGFQPDMTDIEGTIRRLHQTGLLMAFILDGECAPVVARHQAFKAALGAEGDAAARAAEELRQALIANQAAFEQFCK